MTPSGGVDAPVGDLERFIALKRADRRFGSTGPFSELISSGTYRFEKQLHFSVGTFVFYFLRA